MRIIMFVSLMLPILIGCAKQHDADYHCAATAVTPYKYLISNDSDEVTHVVYNSTNGGWTVQYGDGYHYIKMVDKESAIKKAMSSCAFGY